MPSRRGKKYWLMKTELDAYSIEDLERDGATCWDGVRNYQARNFMRDQMQVGDEVLFHHSGGKSPGVAGVARVCRDAYPDHTQFDPKSKYHDPKATEDEPRWFMVDIEFVERFPKTVPLKDLRDDPKLEGMPLLQKGQRLSVQPVSAAHFKRVRAKGRQ